MPFSDLEEAMRALTSPADPPPSPRQRVPMPPSLSAPACALVDALLIEDDTRRLGACIRPSSRAPSPPPALPTPAEGEAQGDELGQLQRHPALARLEWAAIEAKQCEPPFPACATVRSGGGGRHAPREFLEVE